MYIQRLLKFYIPSEESRELIHIYSVLAAVKHSIDIKKKNQLTSITLKYILMKMDDGIIFRKDRFTLGSLLMDKGHYLYPKDKFAIIQAFFNDNADFFEVIESLYMQEHWSIPDNFLHYDTFYTQEDREAIAQRMNIFEEKAQPHSEKHKYMPNLFPHTMVPSLRKDQDSVWTLDLVTPENPFLGKGVQELLSAGKSHGTQPSMETPSMFQGENPLEKIKFRKPNSKIRFQTIRYFQFQS